MSKLYPDETPKHHEPTNLAPSMNHWQDFSGPAPVFALVDSYGDNGEVTRWYTLNPKLQTLNPKP